MLKQPLPAFLRCLGRGALRLFRPVRRAAPPPAVWAPILALAAALALPAPSAAHDYTLGTATTSGSLYPLRTSQFYARTQAIYPASEIPTGGTITAIGLDVTTAPSPEVPGTWTIRVKHRAESTFAAGTTTFEDAGLQTVYEGSVSITTQGRHWFVLDTPFAYNGTDNLLVDFHLHNTTTSTTHGKCSGQAAANDTLARSGSTEGALAVAGAYGYRPILGLRMAPTVIGADPSSALNNGPVTTTVTGLHLDDQSIVRFAGDGGYRPTSNVGYQPDGKSLTCTVDLTGAGLGFWDIVVISPDGGSDRGVGKFDVQGSGGPLLAVEAANLDAARQRAGSVILAWSPPAGPDVVGFRILRAAGRSGPFVRVNRKLIAAGSRAFRLVDSRARGLPACFYRLESVLSSGRVVQSPVVSAHGPHKGAATKPEQSRSARSARGHSR